MAAPNSLIQTEDQNLNRVQRNIQNTLNTLQESTNKVVTYVNGRAAIVNTVSSPPFSAGTLITIPLTSAQDNLVPHQLGKVPFVWMLAGQDTNSTVWSPVSPLILDVKGNSLSSNQTYLNLRCSTTCNVVLWVA